LAISGAAQSQPFSHRIHLAAKLDCTLCHAAALTSTRAADNLLPKPEVCLKCHKTAPIGPPPSTRLARFDHQLHLKPGNIAPLIAAAIDQKTYLSPPPANLRAALNTSNPCEACHRGLETSDAPSRSSLPQMADCLVCHNQIDPPYSCEFCHAPGANLKPASHTADFLDTHTTGKLGLDQASCAVCHGRHFRCLGCH
jgi:hypothetical protein